MASSFSLQVVEGLSFPLLFHGCCKRHKRRLVPFFALLGVNFLFLFSDWPGSVLLGRLTHWIYVFIIFFSVGLMSWTEMVMAVWRHEAKKKSRKIPSFYEKIRIDLWKSYQSSNNQQEFDYLTSESPAISKITKEAFSVATTIKKKDPDGSQRILKGSLDIVTVLSYPLDSEDWNSCTSLRLKSWFLMVYDVEVIYPLRNSQFVVEVKVPRRYELLTKTKIIASCHFARPAFLFCSTGLNWALFQIDHFGQPVVMAL